jgi:hypothetical protein
MSTQLNEVITLMGTDSVPIAKTRVRDGREQFFMHRRSGAQRVAGARTDSEGYTWSHPPYGYVREGDAFIKRVSIAVLLGPLLEQLRELPGEMEDTPPNSSTIGLVVLPEPSGDKEVARSFITSGRAVLMFRDVCVGHLSPEGIFSYGPSDAPLTLDINAAAKAV